MIANAERSKAASEHKAVAGIPVPDQIVRCPLPAARFRELIGDPLSGRVRRYAKPQDLSPAMPHDQEPIQEPERGSRHHETDPWQRCRPHDCEEMSSIPATEVQACAP